MTKTSAEATAASASTPPRPKSAWWRLRWTIRTLLLLVTVLALLLAWIGRTIRAVQHRAEVAKALDERSSDFQPDWSAVLFGDWSSVEVTDVDISYRETVNDDLLEEMRVFRMLDTVSINGQAVTDRSFAALRGMPAMKTLTIEACDITDATMEHIATLPNLEDLTLRGVGVTDKGLARLYALPKLTSLTLDFTLISPKAVKAFQEDRPECVVGFAPAAGKAQVEAAKGIMRRDANLLYDSETRLITAMIFSMDEKPWRQQDWALLHAIPEIQAVSIDELPSATEAIRQVQKMPNVESLTLDSVPVTLSDVALLSQYPKLVELHFLPENLTDAHLAGIANLQNLRRLEIEPDGGMISRRGIEALTRLKQLKHLKISSVPILDEDLEPLSALPALAILDLSSTPITDQALDHVLKMPQLRELILNETQITGVGAQRIMRSRQIESATWTDTGIKPEFFVRPQAESQTP